MKAVFILFSLVIATQAMPHLEFMDDHDVIGQNEEEHGREKRDVVTEDPDWSQFGNAEMVIYVKQNVDVAPGGCCQSGCNGGCNHECPDEGTTLEPETST